MSTSNNDDKTRAVEKALGEPTFAEFPPNTWKIRTNLIIISAVSYAVTIADLHVDQDATMPLLGFKFHGISDDLLIKTLIGITLYLLVHFFWCSFDSFLEWRLRVTGTRVAFITGGRWVGEEEDYPDDPRQSTLYNWWRGRAKEMGSLAKKCDDVNEQLLATHKFVLEKLEIVPEQYRTMAFVKIVPESNDNPPAPNSAIKRLAESVKATQNTLESLRIPISLARFDSWFELFLRSQNLRWLLVDFLVPVLAASYALVLLFCRILDL